MKSISLHQPWASAIALGLKRWETRGRPTHIRGRIAIHAAKKDTVDLERVWDDFMWSASICTPFAKAGYSKFLDLPFGAIIATADLVDCIPTEVALLKGFISSVEQALGNYLPGRFAWKLENVRPLAKPIPFKGRQGWFEVPDSLLAA